MRPSYPQTVPKAMSYPDDAAQEMALLGSSYPEIRVAVPRYSAIKETVESELEETLAEVDPDAVLVLLDIAPELIFSDEDIEDDETNEEMMIFVYQCRKIVRCMLALQFLDQKREAMIRAGRLIGDAEFSARMQTYGPDSELWLSSSLRDPGEVVMRGR